MKIEKNIAFKITGNNPAQSSINKLQPGGSVHARILERLNTREAIIDFSGKKVRVEFLKGVPRSKTLILVLEGRESNTFYFKILDRSNKTEILSRMADFTIFDLDEMKNANIILINKSLKGGLPGIYAYNMLLLKELRKSGDDKNDRTSSIIKNLIKMGMKPDNALFLSMLLHSGKGLNLEQMITLMMILRFSEGRDFKDRGKNNLTDNIKEKIEAVIKTINDSKESGEKNEIIQDLLEYLTSNSNAENRAFSSGEILYVDDNDCKALKYIYNFNSIVISLDLTFIGNLEVLIKNDNSQCNIVFFCEDDKSMEALKSGKDLLFSGLKDTLNKNVNIFFNNRKESAEKIIEIYSFLSLSKGIDIRV